MSRLSSVNSMAPAASYSQKSTQVMDLSPFLICSPLYHGLGKPKDILLDYGVRPALEDGHASYDRAFTEELVILIGLVNGFDRVIILNYPHKSHFQNGVHYPHPNHITVAFGLRDGKTEKAHVYLSEVRPYVVCRRKGDKKIDVVWGGHLGYTFEPVESFVVKAWLDPKGQHVTSLNWAKVHDNQVKRRLKTSGILNLASWRISTPKTKASEDAAANGVGKGLCDVGKKALISTKQDPLTRQKPQGSSQSRISGPPRKSSDHHHGENYDINWSSGIKKKEEEPGTESDNDDDANKENKPPIWAFHANFSASRGNRPRPSPRNSNSWRNNWRDTMSPLPAMEPTGPRNQPGEQPSVDPWRELERLCRGLPDVIEKAKEAQPEKPKAPGKPALSPKVPGSLF